MLYWHTHHVEEHNDDDEEDHRCSAIHFVCHESSSYWTVYKFLLHNHFITEIFFKKISGEGVGKGAVWVCSLVKQKKKAKICFVIYIAGYFFKKKFCYEVIVKQKIYKRSSNYYSRMLEVSALAGLIQRLVTRVTDSRRQCSGTILLQKFTTEY